MEDLYLIMVKVVERMNRFIVDMKQKKENVVKKKRII